MVSSALSKNGVFYVMPLMSADTAYLLTRINDVIRYCALCVDSLDAC